MKFKTRVFLTIIILPLIITIFITSYYVTKLEEKIWHENETYVFHLLSALNNRIDDLFYRVDSLIMMASENTTFKEALEESEDLDNSALKYNEQFKKINQTVSNSISYMSSYFHGIKNVTIIDNEGNSFFTGRDKFDYSYDFTLCDTYGEINELDGSKIILPLGPKKYLTSNIEDSFSIARVLKDKSSFKPICTIIVDIEANELNNAIGRINDSMISQIIVTNNSGGLLYNTNGNNSLSESEKKVISKINQLNSSSTFVNLNNQKYIITKHISSNQDFFSYSLINYQTLINPIRELFLTSITIFIGILLIAVLLTYIFTKSTTGRIIKIEELSIKVAEGNLDLKFETKGKDEIAILAKSLNLMVAKLKNLIRVEQKLAFKEKQTRIDFLFSQINPHYLYNVLNSSYMSSISNNDTKTAEFTKHISDLLRYILYQDQIITLENEIKILEKFINIQEMRYPGKFIVRYRINKDTVSCHLPKMLLQPIVENSIKYGILESDNQGIITISSNFTTNKNNKQDLKIIISDNGVGICNDVIDDINHKLSIKHEGDLNTIGLYNVNERIKLLYGDDYGITLERNTNGGISVIILIKSNMCFEEKI